MLKLYTRLVGALLLVSAGAIHTFPILWRRWDEYLQSDPSAHWVIGSIAFSTGVINVFLVLVDIYARVSNSRTR